MRSLLSFLVFLLTLILGAVAFAYATTEFSGVMHKLAAAAHTLPDQLQAHGLGAQYADWANILLGGDKLIFLSFIIAARLFLTVTAAFVGFVLACTPTIARPADSPPQPAIAAELQRLTAGADPLC
jgi:hypothetical protein